MSNKLRKSNKRAANSESREQGASKQPSIAVQKRRISFLNVLHMFLWVLLVVRQLTQFWNFSVNNIFGDLITFESSPWEPIWIVGTLFVVILTQISLKRRNFKLLRFSNITIVCFNIVPILYAIITQFQKAYALFSDKDQITEKYVIGVWYLFLLICVQIHGVSLYLGESLYSQWCANSSKKQKKM